MKFFPSRYPIVEAFMTGVSDINLAVAVADAGAFPSLMLPKEVDEADCLLQEYVKLRGNCNLLVAQELTSISKPGFAKMIHKHSPTHIELFRFVEDGRQADFEDIDARTKIAFHAIRRTTKILMRIYEPTSEVEGVDGFCIKGKESAGRSGEWSVRDLFDNQIQQHRRTALIPYGGIGTPEQVAYYINRGAPAVAVGTLFAACRESCLSDEVKNKMIQSSSTDLKRTNYSQNYLQLGENDYTGPDDWNRRNQLIKSIPGDGNTGFIYAGQALDHVDRIRTVKETVEYLVSELDQ